MVDAFTNRGLVLQVTGENVGTWGTDLNNNMITITDQILGSSLSYALSSGTNNLSQTQSKYLAYTLTGTLSSAAIVTLPLNIATSATTAVGGTFIFNNQTTGAYTVTVKTVAVGSTGVTVPQGLRATLYSDGTNVYYDNDGGKGSAFSVNSYAGNPNGAVTCIPGSATTPADMLWDRTNNVLYVCTAAPNTWTQTIPAAVTSIPTPVCGMLTLASSSTNPVLANDSAAATTVYYTPYTGSIIGIPNGSTFSTYTFSQLTLALNSTYQVASGIYDVFAFVSSGSAAIGFGPIWTTGGGSVTAGSCARGTGAGSTQLSRLLGTYVNTVAMTLNNGATTYSISAMCGTYLGSVFVDSTAGQVTCHTSVGQSRKWGVWNAYNRLPIVLLSSETTVSTYWSYTSATFRPSNNNSGNSVTVFCGLAEELISSQFTQHLYVANSGSVTGAVIAIGWNSTSSPVGLNGLVSTTLNFIASNETAEYYVPKALGINNVYSLESGSTGIECRFYSDNGEVMLLSSTWSG